MTRILRYFFALLLVLFSSLNQAHGQCTTNIYGAWGSLNPTCNGTYQNATTSGWAGEYSPITVVSGNAYSFQSSVGTDIVTISTTASAVLAFGTGTATWTATFSGTVWFWTHRPGCTGEAVSRTRRVMCTGAAPSGCLNTSSFGSATAPSNATPVTITTCQFQTEYSTIFSIVAGSTYQVTNSCNGYITVRQDVFNGVVVAQGNAPLTFTAPTSGTYYIHYNTTSACGTATNCCTTTIACTSCASGPCLQPTPYLTSAAPVSCGAPVTNFGLWAGEYTTFTGVQNGVSYQFSSTTATDWLVITNAANAVLASGTTPVSYTAAFTGDVRVHVSTNNSCGTQIAGRDITATRTAPCTPPTPTSATASATTVCTGQNTSLTATGVSGTVHWFAGSCATTGQVGTGTPLTVSPTTTTTYFARNFNGGQWSDGCASVTVTVVSPPNVNAGTPLSICAGDAVNLNGSVSGAGAGGPGSLTTTFASGNTCWGGNMFDLTTNTNPLTVNGFTLNPSSTGNQNVSVYFKVGTFNGFAATPAAWTLLGTYNFNGVAATPVFVPTGNIAIPANTTYGIYVAYDANYTDGSTTYANADLTFSGGVGHCNLFDNCCIPRIFNGIIHYTVGGSLTFSWSPPTGLSSTTILNPVANPAATTVYTLTANNGVCSATSNVTITVNTPSTAPTAAPVSGTVCPNTNILLTAAGGTAGSGSNIFWYTGPNGTGTFIGTGASVTVAPNATTTYYARRQGTCNTTADSPTIVSVKNYVYAANGTTSNTYCTDNAGWHHFFSGDEIIFSVQGNLSSAPAGFPVATIFNNGTYFQQTQGPGTASGCTMNITPGEERFEMQRSWNINYGGGAPMGSYNIRFYYPPAERAAIENAANAWIATYPACQYTYKHPTPQGFFWFKNNGANYVAPQFEDTQYPGTVAMTSTGVNYAQWAGITGFSGGSGAIILTPLDVLPVTLTTFHALCEDKGVRIHWSTASEQNSSHFDLERSRDGLEWEVLTTLQAAGTTSMTQDYSHLDKQTGGSILYYRLRQVDQDGTQELYGPVSANCQLEGNMLTVFPNPATNSFTVQVIADALIEGGQLGIYDFTGKAIVQEYVDLKIGVQSFLFNETRLAPGVYFIRLSDSEGRFTPVRLVIQ